MNMNNKSKSTLMIILGFLFLLTAGIVADTTNLYWTSFACLVISIINLFFGFGILIGAPIIEWNIIMHNKNTKKVNYRLARTLVEITGIMLGIHLVLELIAVRKPEYWYVLPVCATLFGLSVIYAIILVVYNAYVDYKSHTPPNE